MIYLLGVTDSTVAQSRGSVWGGWAAKITKREFQMNSVVRCALCIHTTNSHLLSVPCEIMINQQTTQRLIEKCNTIVRLPRYLTAARSWIDNTDNTALHHSLHEHMMMDTRAISTDKGHIISAIEAWISFMIGLQPWWWSDITTQEPFVSSDNHDDEDLRTRPSAEECNVCWDSALV